MVNALGAKYVSVVRRAGARVYRKKPAVRLLTVLSVYLGMIT